MEINCKTIDAECAKDNSISYKWSNINYLPTNKQDTNLLKSRYGCAAAIDINNLPICYLFIHGGQSFNKEFYNDIFVLRINIENKTYDIAANYNRNNCCKQIWPKERNSHLYYQNNKILYIYGGGNSEGLLSDCYTLNIDNMSDIKNEITNNNNNNIWKEIKMDITTIDSIKSCNNTNYNNSQFNIEMGSMIVYNNSMNNISEVRLAIIGGRLYDNISSNIFIYKNKLNDISQMQLECIVSMPIKLCSFSYIFIKERYLIIYGGIDGELFLNSIYVIDVLNNFKWYYFKHSNEYSIVGSIASMMASDDDNIIIFGGSSLNKENNQISIIQINRILDFSNLIEIKCNNSTKN